MAKNYFTFLLLLVCGAFTKVKAQDAPVLTFNIPAQNNLKYNRFLLNPTFSFVREYNAHITLYHRNQWIQFDDSPKLYLLAYSGRYGERAGIGLGIYQHNLGVISSFGGVANYAYNVKLWNKMNLTVGFNLAYYNSGVNKNKVVSQEPDPIILAMRNNSILSIKPGFNFNYGGLDVGFFAENFIDYDFKSNDMTDDYTDKTFSGHIMYTLFFPTAKGLLENGEGRLMFRGRQSQENGFGLNASILLDFPRMGWFQAGMDDFYGLSAGAGFHLSKKLSLGYAYEHGTKEGIVNLGPTHEITMAFSINDRVATVLQSQQEKDSLKTVLDSIQKTTIANKTEKAAEPAFNATAELEKLKGELDEESRHLLDVLMKEDSIANVQKAEFEQKVKNLKEYAQREKAARLAKQADTLSVHDDELLTALDSIPIDLPVADLPTDEKSNAETDKKIEEDIKKYYARKTNKPRSTRQEINKLMIEDIDPGYYIIANVFATAANSDAFIESLKSKGINANYFTNPKINYRYVYLKKHKSWREALISYYSNINNTYFDPIWITSVNIVK